MNKKTRYIAFNTHLFLCVMGLALSAGFLWASVSEKESIAAIISMLIGLPALFVIFISPIVFVFTEEDVTIVYWFGLRETIRWRSIRKVSKFGSWIGNVGGLPHYVLSYPQHSKKVFFMNGEIPKTHRTKKLIRKFYKKKIV